MTQTAFAQPASNSKPLSLDASDTILVKFFFTNEQHVPRGIPKIGRTSSYALDFTHKQQAITAGKADLGAVGRHRESRVDTGEPVISDLHGVQATLLKEDLLKTGFALKNLHWMEQRKTGRPTKFVVVCEFVRGKQACNLPQAVLDALDYLSHTSRWICHVWDNSALGKPTTINFVVRQTHIPASYYLMVVGNAIEAIPVKR